MGGNSVTAVLVALIAPAHANFTAYGVMNKLMTGIETPTCSQYTKWVKAHPGEREVLKEWLLGFRSGLESQMAYEPEYDKATGSEQSIDVVFSMLNGLCSKFPKAQVLYAVQLSVDYGLKESIKHHNPNYNPGFNVLGVLSHHTCQNLLAEVEETATPSGRTVKGPLRPERKFLMEEWMLGVASGIEARVLYGKPMSETTTSRDS